MHYDQEQLTRLYYGEMDDDGHLSQCVECRLELEKLAAVLDRLTGEPAPHRPENYPELVWSRVEKQIGGRRRSWKLPPWASVAAVAAMLAIAFQLGRQMPKDPEKTPPVEAFSERIRDAELGRHLERSRFILAELANAEGAAADLSMERERAEALLASNRLYRVTATQSGQPLLEETLEDLERLLLDLARAPETSGPQFIKELRSRIEQQHLLFRVRVLESQYRAKTHLEEDTL
jgi:hypothetical protein